MLDTACLLLIYYLADNSHQYHNRMVALVDRNRRKQEKNRMSTPLEPEKNERQSTYFVQDRRNKEEQARLTIQDKMLTASMGGVLPEQTDPTSFRHVLDVACGTGGWAIEVAKKYPAMSLTGIDISDKMIAYANERAKVEQVAERVSFRVMDTLRALEFPPDSFDLVNLRLAVSFVRTWDWPQVLNEFERITRNGGIIRLTEGDVGETSNSEALTSLGHILLQGFYNAGNFFTDQRDGLTSELVPLMTRRGLSNVQTREHILTYHAGTLAGQYFAEDMQHLFRTLRPFLQKWARVPENYDELYQQALIDMQQPGFIFTWRFVTAWGMVNKRKQEGWIKVQ